ncbi:hypothetical protein THAOC_16825 [Thalassiosira oceanica]|uniref:Uncharacterized protein n=1 Tax=Thalassiosira oceanica TaxID=159749 RepID=K0SW96_THAOC|nr:hypothetical protein THAOC_16825 [Thalassiosira oceanica]|eukprot:EJK62557.1 hypothetical protein THAOC_16825 [Thalassiosira oceanica]
MRSNLEEEPVSLAKPICHSSYDFPTDAAEYLTIDSQDKLTTTWSWSSRTYTWLIPDMHQLQKQLLGEHAGDAIKLVRCEFDGGITMYPYHEKVQPHYDYFASTVKTKDDLESIRIANFFLPPGSYFEDTILPLLDRSKNTLETLELSNCGLSKDNIKAVLDFVSKNESLHSLDLSNNILDVETATLLSSAIKGHPILYRVNLEKSDLGGGDLGVLNKLLYGCKDIDELLLGHTTFDTKCVDLLSKFIGKKISLTILSLDGPKLGSKSKRALARGLKKNKSLRELCIHNNGAKFEEIFGGDNVQLLRRLTRLDFSGNSFPTSGAQVLASYLSDNTTLQSLKLSKCRLRTEAAKVFLPELERNTTLVDLDLSRNHLDNDVAPAVCNVLKPNTTLASLNLEQNNNLRVMSGGRRKWNRVERAYETKPAVLGGRSEIISCLFDTSSLQSLADSNHTCMVVMKACDYSSGGRRIEKLMKSINSLENVGKKVRYKVVLALNETEGLYNVRDFDSVPLELIPKLLELIQLDIGYYGFGKDIVEYETDKKYGKGSDMRINRLYDFVTGSNIQLLFERGSGLRRVRAFDPDNSKKRRRRKFGEERDDSDDENFKPPPGLGQKHGRYRYDSELGRYRYTSPSPYKLPPRAKLTRNRED